METHECNTLVCDLHDVEDRVNGLLPRGFVSVASQIPTPILLKRTCCAFDLPKHLEPELVWKMPDVTCSPL